MKLSICIPTYNRLTDLQVCLTSVMGAIDIANAHSTVEILVSNNASTDGTTEYLEGLRKYTGSYIFKTWTNETNIGGVANVKKLLGAAGGKYVFMLTDDDYLVPSALVSLDKYLVNEYAFIKTAVISNLIFSKRCFYYGVKNDVSDILKSVNFVEIMSYSHIISGCIVRNSKTLQIKLQTSSNVYPSIEMCSLNAGKCIAVAEPIVVHQWENPIYWETDVDMSSGKSKQNHLDRDAQSALLHIDVDFLSSEAKQLLCRHLLSKYGYIEPKLKTVLGTSYDTETKRFKNKLLLKTILQKIGFRRNHKINY